MSDASPKRSLAEAVAARRTGRGRRLTDAQKQQIVDLVRDTDLSYAEIARRIGVGDQAVRRFVVRAMDGR